MTKTQKLGHVESWGRSGLSRPAYCREHGLNYSTFMTWFKQAPSRVSKGSFVALSKKEAPCGAVEIIFPNGIRLHYKGELSGSLIEVLQNA